MRLLLGSYGMIYPMTLELQAILLHLSVIVRENRAGAKDRGRRLTSTFLP